jgi:hypothetical protein
MSTVSMQELELETAELLPSRETLCVPSYSHKSSGVSVTQVNGSNNGNGDGNGSILGGWFDGDLSGNNIIL